MKKGYYSPQEIALRWSVDKATVVRMIRTGKLEGFKIGRLWRVSPEALKAFEDRNRPTPPPPIVPRSQRRIVTRIT